MSGISTKDTTLAESNIVHCDLKRSQQGPGGFDLTGSVYLNRGRVVFKDGYHLDFYLTKCEITVNSYNCTFNSDSIAFVVQNHESRKVTLTQEVDLTDKQKNSTAVSGSLGAEIGDSSQKWGLTAKGDKSRSREITADQKQRRTIAPEERICQSTTLVSRSSSSVTWELRPDHISTEQENGVPKGALLGEYMRNGDNSLATVRFPDRPLDQADDDSRVLRVSIGFLPAQIKFMPPGQPSDWGLTRTIGSLLTRMQEPSLRSLVARLKLAKSIRQSIPVLEV